MEKNSRVEHTQALVVQGRVTPLEEKGQGGEEIKSQGCSGLGSAGMGDVLGGKMRVHVPVNH